MTVVLGYTATTHLCPLLDLVADEVSPMSGGIMNNREGCALVQAHKTCCSCQPLRKTAEYMTSMFQGIGNLRMLHEKTAN